MRRGVVKFAVNCLANIARTRSQTNCFCSDVTFSQFPQQLCHKMAKALEHKPLLVVAGCTGTGKSDLGVALAKRFNGEVISADSMQIYKGLDIVTNKITAEEAQQIPHHLMSFLDPNQEYNVHAFKNDALQQIHSIWARNRLPILVGGTAYYIESVMYKDALIELDASREEVENLRAILFKKPIAELYKQLKKLDPEAACLVHPNNHFRVLRALEICLLSGAKKSELNAAQRQLRFPKTLLFIMDASLDVLDARLDKRVITMQEKGVVEELDEYYQKHQHLLGTHGVNQSIGIKEFQAFLQLTADERKTSEGQEILKKCFDDLKLHTRQYSRTQRKWFRSRFFRRSKLREVPQCLVLDTSENFNEVVVPYALSRAQEFLDHGLVSAVDSPCLIKNQLTVIEDQEYVIKANTVFRCDLCKSNIHSEMGYKQHLKGRKHMNALAKQRKRLRAMETKSRDKTLDSNKNMQTDDETQPAGTDEKPK